jgi:hypothetical protein
MSVVWESLKTKMKQPCCSPPSRRAGLKEIDEGHHNAVSLTMGVSRFQSTEYEGEVIIRAVKYISNDLL